MIKITKASDNILTENLIIVIYGEPGAGKTSLAFSAKRPLLLDADLGSQRAVGRKDVVQISSWNDIANLTAEDLRDYDTIIVDTIGRFLEVLVQNLIKTNPAFAQKTGELKLQGYGALNSAFKAWIAKIRIFHKDIIFIAHSKEEKKGESIFVRADALGSSKNELYKIADLLGYVSMKNKERHLDFYPSDFHLGKNCAGIDEQKIPDYVQNQSFMQSIIETTKNRMNQKSAEQVAKEKEFNEVLAEINSIKTPEEATALIIKVLNNTTLKIKLHTVATKELGFNWDEVHNCYNILENPTSRESK